MVNRVKALVRLKGKYLILKKAKDNLLKSNIGKWECCGGSIEGKKPEQTIIDEVNEETGLKTKSIIGIGVERVPDHICYVYLIDVKNDKVKLSEEHSEFKWILPEDFKTYSLVKFADLLIKYFEKFAVKTK